MALPHLAKQPPLNTTTLEWSYGSTPMDKRSNLYVGAEISIDDHHGAEHRNARVLGLAWNQSKMRMRVHAKTSSGTEVFVSEDKVVIYIDE